MKLKKIWKHSLKYWSIKLTTSPIKKKIWQLLLVETKEMHSLDSFCYVLQILYELILDASEAAYPDLEQQVEFLERTFPAIIEQAKKFKTH